MTGWPPLTGVVPHVFVGRESCVACGQPRIIGQHIPESAPERVQLADLAVSALDVAAQRLAEVFTYVERLQLLTGDDARRAATEDDARRALREAAES